MVRPTHAQQSAPAAAHNPLARILVSKGILTPEEAKSVDQAASPQEANERMARILLDKGVLSKADYEQIAGKTLAPAPQSPASIVAKEETLGSASAAKQPAAATQEKTSGLAASLDAQSAPNPTEPGAPSLVEKHPAKDVVSALTPIRALPVGGVPRNTAPAWKSGGVGVTPYGFIKATAVEDSSSPYGDDMPLPGFISDSGPDSAPEFHVKARATRIGMNFAWYDPSPKWSITGKIEFDFEGNFNRSDNRNISSVRSVNPSLRLAYGRLDYSASSKDTISLLFGQDWTPFGSSTEPNMLETTSMGIGFGTLYERTPQMRVGYTRALGGLKIMPEIAITNPAVGLTPAAANISQQLGYGERQGSDSNRPDVEGRIAAQWQLDHAAGVAPAQIILSGEHGSRRAIVLASAVPAAYAATFSTGAAASSHTNGWTAEWQLPTRFATLIGKFYGGADLRYFFINQLYSYYSDTTGLTNTASVNSLDGASAIVFGTTTDGQHVVAPERPIRTMGGFAQLGLPLSRWFNARPGGRNAGWSLYALYSIDQAKTRDLNRLGASGNRRYSTIAAGTLNYSLDKWVSFSLEESLYTTHANPEQPLPLFRGVPSREWNDVRTEFGPIFNF